MADSVNATGLRVQQWDEEFFTEFVRENKFAAYLGTDESALFQVKEDLTKKKGDRITFAMVNRLTQSAITGTNTLEGNEEDMSSRSHLLTVDKRRNAVRVAEMSEQRSAIDLRMAAKATLKDWAIEDARMLAIGALNSFRSANTIQTWTTSAELFANSDATSRDAWLVDNADRTVWGSAGTGGSVFATQHALLDNTDDKMKASVLTTAKILAQTASPKIRPIRTKGDEEWYVVFMHPYQLRDLVLSDSSSVLLNATRDAMDRGRDNPLFTGANFIWNGLIIREIPELPIVAGGVASHSAVATCCAKLCGAQALGMGLAKRWKSVTKDFDYGDKVGVAIEQIYGVEKLCFGSGSGDTDDLKQNGVVDVWTTAVA